MSLNIRGDMADAAGRGSFSLWGILMGRFLQPERFLDMHAQTAQNGGPEDVIMLIKTVA